MKKQITLEQLEKDGIAQIKTKRQLLNQNMTINGCDDYVIDESTKDEYYLDEWEANHIFGKCVKVEGIDPRDNDLLITIPNKDANIWIPLDMVAK